MPDLISVASCLGVGNGERFLFKIKIEASEILIPAIERKIPNNCN